jgi:hypothetical protein
MLESGRGLVTLPRWFFRERDWIIEFFASQNSANLRGKDARSTLGLKLEGAKWLDPRQSIVDAAVESKASKYGDLDLPFVVAVNCLEDADPNLDVFTAFYGSERWPANVETGEATFQGLRRDGVWMGKAGPQNRRASAVLIAFPVHPWNLTRAPICLYHHPFASKTYAGSLTRLPQMTFVAGKAVRVEGMSIGDVFGLPRNSA